MFKKQIDKNKNYIINDLVEFAKIKTVTGLKRPNMPFGEGVHKGLKYILEIANTLEFKSQNFSGYCGKADAGIGEYTVGILCHVDVLDEGMIWSKSPFGGEISDGKIYGRGISKVKAPVIACLYAMKFLKDENLIPEDKKVRMIIGTDKEIGMKSINFYKEYEIAPDVGFTPDGVFPVIYGEKGVINADIEMDTASDFDAPINIVEIIGGESINSVPSKVSIILSCEEGFREKVEYEIKSFSEAENIKYNFFAQNKLINIEFIGKSANSSTPENGINAISYGIKFLSIFEEFVDKRDFVHEYNKLISTGYNGEKINCNIMDQDSGKFTFNVSVIELINGEAKLLMDITYPISYIYSDVLQLVKDAFKYSPLRITNISHIRPVSFSKDSFVVKKLMKAYREATGDEESEPYVTTDGTYARAISNTVSFGPIFSKKVDLTYKADEYIEIDTLMELVEIYAMGIYELLK